MDNVIVTVKHLKEDPVRIVTSYDQAVQQSIECIERIKENQRPMEVDEICVDIHTKDRKLLVIIWKRSPKFDHYSIVIRKCYRVDSVPHWLFKGNDEYNWNDCIEKFKTLLSDDLVF